MGNRKLTSYEKEVSKKAKKAYAKKYYKEYYQKNKEKLKAYQQEYLSIEGVRESRNKRRRERTVLKKVLNW